MLFGYPIAATQENWLHDCLIQMLQIIHQSISTGQTPPVWPLIIPQEFRSRLRRRTRLRSLLEDYQTAAALLSIDQLMRVSTALVHQNDISGLLSGTCSCEKIGDLPEAIIEPTKKLFEFGFNLLSKLEIRDRQYKVIFESTPYHICPFCGCEYFDAPGAPREALDHYLAESKYTFAATNLRNLVPMGNKCNSKYKLAQDILYDDDGLRRTSINPYDDFQGVKISLQKSVPFVRPQGIYILPDWQIEFEPDSNDVSTWISVFHIEERYKRDNLDPEFPIWLSEFQAYCRSRKFHPNTEQHVLAVLDAYLTYLTDLGVKDRAFLKLAVFEMLKSYYISGDDTVKFFINTIAIGGIA